MNDPLPDGLVSSHSSPVFTQDTIPAALQREHALAPGHWGMLNILEGSLRFANLETGETRRISAPNRVTIHPRMRHRVAVDGPVRCRIDFLRDKRD